MNHAQYPQSTSPPPHRPIPQYAQYQQEPYNQYSVAGSASIPGGAHAAPASYVPGVSTGQMGAPPGAGHAGNYGASQAPGVPYGAPFQQFMSDPTAQLGAKLGMDAFSYGQNYFNQNMEKYANVGSIRYYFQVSNSYVLRKLLLIMFPWRHKPWSRQLKRDGQNESYAYPRDDLNAPDMYIPAMAFTTWLTVVAIVSGLQGKFHPKLIGLLASKSLAILIVELVFLKIFTYLLAAQSKLLDFSAFAGYKFIGVTITILVSALVPSAWIKYAVFLYTASSTAFFMLRSLRFIMLEATSAGTATVNSSQRQHRIQFLFFYTFVCQYVLMWLLL